MDPKPSITLLNKTDTCDRYGFKNNINNDVECNALQEELLMSFEGYSIFGFWESYKNLLCILVEVNKTMYGNNEGVTKKLLEIFYTDLHVRDGAFVVVSNVVVADEKNNVN
jgi:hypothetical protein